MLLEILLDFSKSRQENRASIAEPEPEQIKNPSIYIFIDALDEIPTVYQTSVLDFLSTLAGLTIENLHILTTSRNNPTIQQALIYPCTWPEMAINHTEIKKDINLFVSRTIDASPRLRVQPNETKNLIIEKLRWRRRRRNVSFQNYLVEKL